MYLVSRVIERQVMKPYRTEQEVLSMLIGEPNYREYDEVLGCIPNEEIRKLINLRLDKKYKNLQFKNEFDIIKSELFSILCEGNKIEKIPTYGEQVYHIIAILSNLRKNTSPYWKEFHNSGMPKSKTISANPYSGVS